MDIRFHTIGKGGIRLDCVVIPTFDDTVGTFAATLGKTPASWLVSSPALGDHTGARGQVTICHGRSDGVVPRAILVGMGDRKTITPGGYRSAVGAAVKQCKISGFTRVAMMLAYCAPVAEALGRDVNDIVQETVIAVLLASYSCTEYRSKDARKKARKEYDPAFFVMESLYFAHTDKCIPSSLRTAVRLAEAEAAGVWLARDLVNAPANIMTPTRMADEALALAKRHGFGCRIVHKAEMAKLGMGALLAVAEGSHKDARFVVLDYFPTGVKKNHQSYLWAKASPLTRAAFRSNPRPGCTG